MNKKFTFFIISLSLIATNLAFQNCTEFVAADSLDLPSLSNNHQEAALTILSNNCRSCHINQALGDVSNILDVSHLLSSQLVLAGQPDNSPLFVAINNNSMPPGAPLSTAEKSQLRTWILQLGEGPVTPVEPVNFNFTYRVNVEPLMFKTRLAKLSSFLGSTNHPSLDKLKTDRTFLGDYDFANKILPKVSWEATDIKAWIEAIEPICSSTDVRNAYTWPNGVNSFFQATLGRAPSNIESTIIQELNNQSITNTERLEVLCLTTLSSLEYTSK